MRQLLVPILFIILPVLLLVTHTAYVANLDTFDDTYVLLLEKKLNDDERFNQYYQDIRLEFNEDEKYTTIENYTYRLIGTGNSFFSNLLEEEKQINLLKISFLLNEILGGDAFIECGKNNFCKITEVSIIDPKTKKTYQQKFFGN